LCHFQGLLALLHRLFYAVSQHIALTQPDAEESSLAPFAIGMRPFQPSLQQWQGLAHPPGQGVSCTQSRLALAKDTGEVHSFAERQRPFEHMYGLGQRPLA